MISLIREVASELVLILTNQINFAFFEDQWFTVLVHDHIYFGSLIRAWVLHTSFLVAILVHVSLYLILVTLGRSMVVIATLVVRRTITTCF